MVTPAARPCASRSNSSLFLRIGSPAPAFMGAYFSALCSALEKVLLLLHLCPLVGVRRRGLARDDGFPGLGGLGIDGHPVALRVRDVILRRHALHGPGRTAP